MDVVTSIGESTFATVRDSRSLNTHHPTDAAADTVVAKITVPIGAELKSISDIAHPVAPSFD
jgi:hypothetical protein